MLRPLVCVLALCFVPSPATAQDGTTTRETVEERTANGTPTEPVPSETTAEPVPSETTAEPEPSTDESSAPKIAVVVVGDPDPILRAAARRVERAVEGSLRLPFDPGLRRALRGEAGEAGDGLEEVRRERRRLGLEEDRDAALLAALGRRAGASALAVVRAGPQEPELLVLDVRNAAFFEGELTVSADLQGNRLARFVTRRAHAAARGALPADVPSPAEAAVAASITDSSPAEEPAQQPELFEQIWPYLVAGALLAGMITAIVLTSEDSGADQPVLRFVPGGR